MSQHLKIIKKFTHKNYFFLLQRAFFDFNIILYENINGNIYESNKKNMNGNIDYSGLFTSI